MLKPAVLGVLAVAASASLMVRGTHKPAPAGEGLAATIPTLAAAMPGATPRPPQGHVLLVVSGNANQLAVDHAVVKTDAWQDPHPESQAYRVRVMAADGEVLGSHAIDLSAFDLRPQLVGSGQRVEGCKVVDTQVHALVSIPNYPDAARLDLVHADESGVQRIGEVDALRWRQLVGGRR